MTKKNPATVTVKDLPVKTESGYPMEFRSQVMGRCRLAGVGNVFGLDQFGVNIVTLNPGAWSSQRHWHLNEDEFVYVLEGEIVLVDDAGDHVMRAGDAAGFKAGNGNGHHLKNLSEKPAIYMEIGTRAKVDHVEYSDIDMIAKKDHGPWTFLKKDGSKFDSD